MLGFGFKDTCICLLLPVKQHTGIATGRKDNDLDAVA